MAAAAIVAGGLAAVGLWAGLASPGGARSGATDAPGTQAMPARFEVVYRVDRINASQSWEVLDVSDPLDVADLTYDHDPLSGAQPVAGTVTTDDGLYDLSGERVTLVSNREPVLGSGDQALGVELPQLDRLGLAVPLHRTITLSGEPCQIVRVSEPPAGPLTRVGSAGHDDVCLTASGLELSEVWNYDGRVVLSRTAVEVSDGRPDPRIHLDPPLPGAGKPASLLLRITSPGTAPVLDPPSPPAGFASLPPVGVIAQDPAYANRTIYTATVWAYLFGGRLITVEGGEGALPWDNAGTPVQAVHLAGLGPAGVVFRSDGPEIQVQLAGSRWVRVRATVPFGQLMAYASGLRVAGRP